MSKKQKIYTAEFKTEAIKTIVSNNGNISETARLNSHRFFRKFLISGRLPVLS